jgi:hypothetical protein
MGAIIGIVFLAVVFVVLVYEIGYCNGYEADKRENSDEKEND